LLEKIGQGARGVVYKARHRLLKRPAPVKLIRSEIANEQATIAEFEHKVQLSAELTHWNSVQIYDNGCVIFECPSGKCLIIGNSFSEIIAKRNQLAWSLEGLPESANMFRDVIVRCLETNPERRFPNVTALKNAMENCV
jgi:serine/threonine protein kinase